MDFLNNSIKLEDDGVYVRASIYNIAKVFGVKLESEDSSLELSDKYNKLLADVRNVYNKYNEWCCNRSNFVSGKFEAVVPFLTDDLVEYWKSFVSAFYITNYVRFGAVFKEIRKHLNNADVFTNSANTSLQVCISQILSKVGVDQTTIEFLCDNTYCNLDTFGKMYWWIEPFICMELRINDIMSKDSISEYIKID